MQPAVAAQSGIDQPLPFVRLPRLSTLYSSALSLEFGYQHTPLMIIAPQTRERRKVHESALIEFCNGLVLVISR